MNKYFKKLHDALLRDLTWNDLNRSFSDDMREMYDFYSKNLKTEEEHQNRIKRAVKFLWFLFIAFLMKLTPPRRLMYAVSLIFMLIAFSQDKITSAVYSFIIVTILLAMELADKLIAKDELSVAREIQLSLQPVGIAVLPGYEYAAHSEAAKEVGGDYYDIMTLPDSSKLIVIGDVSGKGISSALYVVKMQTALQLFASETSDLRELLIRLNSHMYGQLKRNYFLSLFLVKLNSDGEIELCRAGHPPALFYNAQENNVSWLKPNGFAVGMAASSNGGTVSDQKSSTDFGGSLESKTYKLQKGDILFLFTDGVSETINADGKEYGEERIADLIKEHGNLSTEGLRDRIDNELSNFRGVMDLRDDTTYILLKRM